MLKQMSLVPTLGVPPHVFRGLEHPGRALHQPPPVSRSIPKYPERQQSETRETDVIPAYFIYDMILHKRKGNKIHTKYVATHNMDIEQNAN